MYICSGFWLRRPKILPLLEQLENIYSTIMEPLIGMTLHHGELMVGGRAQDPPQVASKDIEEGRTPEYSTCCA